MLTNQYKNVDEILFWHCLLNWKWGQFKSATDFVYTSQAPNPIQESEELHAFPEIYKYSEPSDTAMCNIGTTTSTLYSDVNWCLSLGSMQWLLWKPRSVPYPELHMFIQAQQSGFIRNKRCFILSGVWKETVAHQFIAVMCDMSCARDIYLYL